MLALRERYTPSAESRNQRAGGSRQKAKGKEQSAETADRRLKTANSKVAFRSHFSRHRSAVVCPGVYHRGRCDFYGLSMRFQELLSQLTQGEIEASLE